MVSTQKLPASYHQYKSTINIYESTTSTMQVIRQWPQWMNINYKKYELNEQLQYILYEKTFN